MGSSPIVSTTSGSAHNFIGNGRRGEDLVGVGKRAHARRNVDRYASDIVTTDVALSGVDAGAKRNRCASEHRGWQRALNGANHEG